MSEDLVVLREILQRELETINAYERMLSRIADPNLRQIIEHVTDEEREHVAEMYELIMERDERQRLRAADGRAQLAGMSLVSAHPSHPSQETAASVAGLGDKALISGEHPGQATPTPEILRSDPRPPPPPLFPDGAWSVGGLKRQPIGEPVGSQ
ncbi:MAG TPA: ferritin-like domain-containing protein [Pseudomonadota bacterium]|nr:ferritin-like domain-containing protein [Pseudomonadota bacterium]